MKFDVVDAHNNTILKIETNSTFRPRTFQVSELMHVCALSKFKIEILLLNFVLGFVR